MHMYFERLLDYRARRILLDKNRCIKFQVSINYFAVICKCKIFFLEKGQLVELIYDLFINKCHFSGLSSYLALILK